MEIMEKAAATKVAETVILRFFWGLPTILLIAGCGTKQPSAWQYTTIQASDGLFASRCIPATPWYDLLQQPPSIWAEFRLRSEGPRLVLCHRKGLVASHIESEVPVYALVSGKPTRKYRMIPLRGGHVWLGSSALTQYVAQELLEGHDVQLSLSVDQSLVRLAGAGFKEVWRDLLKEAKPSL